MGRSKYKTRPLEDALQGYFKNENLFGGNHESSKSYARKVAVTAACETGDQAVIFTNYNRPASDKGEQTATHSIILLLSLKAHYSLERPDEPTSELKLWEA